MAMVFVGSCHNSRLGSLYGIISVWSSRNGGDAAPLTTCTLVLVYVTDVASAVFTRCAVMVDKLIGLAFTSVFGAPEFLVLYSKLFVWLFDYLYNPMYQIPWIPHYKDSQGQLKIYFLLYKKNICHWNQNIPSIYLNILNKLKYKILLKIIFYYLNLNL